MEENHLERCIKSCIQSLNNQCQFSIKLIDGAYKSFIQSAKIEAAQCYSKGYNHLGDSFMRFTTPFSSDKTLEIAKQYNCEITISPEEGWENEIIKRSEYFKCGEYCRTNNIIYHLIIDADEIIKGILPINTLIQSDDWTIQLQRDDGIPAYPVFRIHKHRHGMKYLGFHNAPHIPVENGLKMLKKADYENNYVLPNILLEHKWAERGEMDQIRHQTKGAYYRQLLQEEGAFREQHGI